jgi:hypothetical protein
VNAPHDQVLIDDRVSDLQLARAAELLKGCHGSVTLDDVATLLPGRREIRCEISAPTPAVFRCEEEYKVLVENAARALRASRLGSVLPDRRLRWSVVDGTGIDKVELWSEP